MKYEILPSLDLKKYFSGDEKRLKLEAESKVFFEVRGYNTEQAIPIILNKSLKNPESERDQSVHFTGSTSNILKQYLLFPERLGMTKFYCNQQKLRTQNIKDYFDEIDISYSSHFHGFGAVVGIQNAQSFLQDIIEYLKILSIGSQAKICCTTPSYEPILCKFFRNQSEFLYTEVPAIRTPEDRFAWKYGELDIHGDQILTGNGMYIEVIDNYGNNLRDIASLEVIYHRSTQQPIALEFGLGYETALSKLNQNESFVHPLRYTALGGLPCFQSSHGLKALDSLMVCLVLANEGLQPGKKNKNFHEVGTIFKQHLNAFCFHSIEENISERDWRECSKILAITKEYTGFENILTVYLQYNAKLIFFQNQILRYASGIKNRIQDIKGIRPAIDNNTTISLAECGKIHGIIRFDKTSLYKKLWLMLSSMGTLNTLFTP